MKDMEMYWGRVGGCTGEEEYEGYGNVLGRSREDVLSKTLCG